MSPSKYDILLQVIESIGPLVIDGEKEAQCRKDIYEDAGIVGDDWNVFWRNQYKPFSVRRFIFFSTVSDSDSEINVDHKLNQKTTDN